MARIKYTAMKRSRKDFLEGKISYKALKNVGQVKRAPYNNGQLKRKRKEKLITKVRRSIVKEQKSTDLIIPKARIAAVCKDVLIKIHNGSFGLGHPNPGSLRVSKRFLEGLRVHLETFILKKLSLSNDLVAFSGKKRMTEEHYKFINYIKNLD